MKKFIPIVFAIYLLSLGPTFSAAYKRYAEPRSPCVNDMNRGIIERAIESRMNLGYNAPSDHKVILKLYEECVKANEGVRFKKGGPFRWEPFYS